MSEEVERGRRARRVAEKVHKLLALAESAAGTPEGDNAALQARRLMDAHALSDGDVSEAGNPMTRLELRLANGVWRRHLMTVVAEHVAAVALFSGGSGGWAFVYGRRSDVEIAEYLFGYLQAETERRCRDFIVPLRERARRDPRGAAFFRGALRSEETAFCNGVVVALHERLRAMRATEERADPDAFALVVTRGAAADAYVRESLGREPGTRRSTVTRASRDGYRAGEAMPIHDGVRSQVDERRQLGADGGV